MTLAPLTSGMLGMLHCSSPVAWPEPPLFEIQLTPVIALVPPAVPASEMVVWMVLAVAPAGEVMAMAGRSAVRAKTATRVRFSAALKE